MPSPTALTQVSCLVSHLDFYADAHQLPPVPSPKPQGFPKDQAKNPRLPAAADHCFLKVGLPLFSHAASPMLLSKTLAPCTCCWCCQECLSLPSPTSTLQGQHDFI